MKFRTAFRHKKSEAELFASFQHETGMADQNDVSVAAPYCMKYNMLCKYLGSIHATRYCIYCIVFTCMYGIHMVLTLNYFLPGHSHIPISPEHGTIPRFRGPLTSAAPRVVAAEISRYLCCFPDRRAGSFFCWYSYMYMYIYYIQPPIA